MTPLQTWLLAACAVRQLTACGDMDDQSPVERDTAYGSVVESGKPEASKLIKAIRHEAGVEAMPKEGDKLPDETIAALSEWITMGLPWPADAAPPPPEKWRAHWAFQPVKMPDIPAPAALPQEFPAWLGGEMDRIILKKLTDSGLTPSPLAEPPLAWPHPSERTRHCSSPTARTASPPRPAVKSSNRLSAVGCQ